MTYKKFRHSLPKLVKPDAKRIGRIKKKAKRKTKAQRRKYGEVPCCCLAYWWSAPHREGGGACPHGKKSSSTERTILPSTTDPT